jgi:phosphatidylserine synthase
MAGVDVAGHYVEAAIAFVVICAGLAVGTFPTMSLKGTTFPASMRLPVILLAVAFVISLFVFPWYTLLFANVIYLMMIPIFNLSKRAKKAAKRS